MADQRTFKEVLRENRRTIQALLLLPVVGMVVAIPLIIVRAPRNLWLSLALILVMLGQYLFFVMLILRRIDRLIAS